VCGVGEGGGGRSVRTAHMRLFRGVICFVALGGGRWGWGWGWGWGAVLALHPRAYVQCMKCRLSVVPRGCGAAIQQRDGHCANGSREVLHPRLSGRAIGTDQHPLLAESVLVDGDGIPKVVQCSVRAMGVST
jgi:hypothetical protein